MSPVPPARETWWHRAPGGAAEWGAGQDPAGSDPARQLLLLPELCRAARPWPRVFQMSENHPMGSILVIYRSSFSKISVGIGALLC